MNYAELFNDEIEKQNQQHQDDEHDLEGGPYKKGNIIKYFGNTASMNMNSMILTNILQSPYYTNKLSEMQTYMEVVDEIYLKVTHLEPWERGSRKTTGQSGMCGGVRGVGVGGIVSTPFCLLYKLFTFKLTRKQLRHIVEHPDSPYIRALGFIYIRYSLPPEEFWAWFEPYLADEELVDPKAGGGCQMTMGELIEKLITKLDWFSTLFPRIPVTIQKLLEERLRRFRRERQRHGNEEEEEGGGDAAHDDETMKKKENSGGGHDGDAMGGATASAAAVDQNDDDNNNNNDHHHHNKDNKKSNNKNKNHNHEKEHPQEKLEKREKHDDKTSGRKRRELEKEKFSSKREEDRDRHHHRHRSRSPLSKRHHHHDEEDDKRDIERDRERNRDRGDRRDRDREYRERERDRERDRHDHHRREREYRDLDRPPTDHTISSSHTQHRDNYHRQQHHRHSSRSRSPPISDDQYNNGGGGGGGKSRKEGATWRPQQQYVVPDDYDRSNPPLPPSLQASLDRIMAEPPRIQDSSPSPSPPPPPLSTAARVRRDAFPPPFADSQANQNTSFLNHQSAKKNKKKKKKEKKKRRHHHKESKKRANEESESVGEKDGDDEERDASEPGKDANLRENSMLLDENNDDEARVMSNAGANEEAEHTQERNEYKDLLDAAKRRQAETNAADKEEESGEASDSD